MNPYIQQCRILRSDRKRDRYNTRFLNQYPRLLYWRFIPFIRCVSLILPASNCDGDRKSHFTERQYKSGTRDQIGNY
ncbi:unnamed protein product, partial [Nesidiocoris tenuis]